MRWYIISWLIIFLYKTAQAKGSMTGTCSHADIHISHMHTHMHTHTHTSTHTHTLPSTHTHIHTHIHSHTLTQAHTHIHSPPHIDSHIPHTYTLPSTHAHIHSHTHSHTQHTHIYSHTHIQKLTSSKGWGDLEKVSWQWLPPAALTHLALSISHFLLQLLDGLVKSVQGLLAVLRALHTFLPSGFCPLTLGWGSRAEVRGKAKTRRKEPQCPPDICCPHQTLLWAPSSPSMLLGEFSEFHGPNWEAAERAWYRL